MLKRKEFLNFRMANAQDANEPEDHTPPTASLTLSNGKKGLSNLKEGQDLDVTMTTADELGLFLTADDSSTSSVSLTAK